MTYEDINLYPGDSFTVIDADGNKCHGTVHSIRHRTAEPEIRQHLTGWRRILRSLTPRRWRKPLPIVRPYRPASTEVIGVSEVPRRMQQRIEDMSRDMSRLVDRLGDGS